jgi:cytochrome P450 family 110
MGIVMGTTPTTTGLPPGFPESSLRQALRFGADPYGLLAEGRRRFGDVFTLRLPGDPPRVVLCAPDDVRRLLTLGPDDYRSDDQGIHLNIGVQSVLFSDGQRHRRRRQLLAPPLHAARLRSYADTMLSIADRHIDRLRAGSVVVARDFLRGITMDAILECVFGVRGDQPAGQRLSQALTRWLDGVLAPHMFMVSLAITGVRLRHLLDRTTRRSRATGRRRRRLLPWRRLGDAKAAVEEILLADIHRAREEGTEGRVDVLALLLDARYDDGSAMDDDDIVDQLVTMLVGGHETTATTLAWALHHLLRDDSALQRARDELSSTFGGDVLDPARAGELRWLSACIEESMRLSPIAPAVSRTLTRPQTFGGWTVPGGTVAWAGVALVHRREDLWPHADRFDPVRFFDAGTPRPEHFLPFGGGRRRCLGAAFAEFEMRIVLARLLQRCDLALAGRDTRAVMLGITVGPSDGVPLHVRGVRTGAGASGANAATRTP